MQEIQYFHRQDDMFKYAEENDFKFFFSYDKISPSRAGAKEFGCSKNIDTFLDFYNPLSNDQKNFYEILKADISLYEYYDLDVKIPKNADPEVYNNQTLFFWFDAIRSQFINFNKPLTKINSQIRLEKPNWIILSSSNSSKLSLHLINKNAIFSNFKTLSIYFTNFKNYFKNLCPNQLFDIDFSVYSRNRNMRIIDSCKYGSDRILTLWNEFHLTAISKKDTFISIADEDPSKFEKTILENDLEYTFSCINEKEPSCKKDKPSITIDSNEADSFQSSDDLIKDLLSILSINRCDDYKDWINIGMALKNDGYEMELWDAWSKQSNKYNKKYLTQTWKGFKEMSSDSSSSRVTTKTIFFFAKEDNLIKFKELIKKHFYSTDQTYNIVEQVEQITTKKKKTFRRKELNTQTIKSVDFNIEKLLKLLNPLTIIENMNKILYALFNTKKYTFNDVINCVKYAYESLNQPFETYTIDTLEDLWDNANPNIIRPVTLGTICYYAKIDNPKEYKKFISTAYMYDINLPFTPDIKINQQYIGNIYKDYLQTHDVVCLKSNLNTGKTFIIPELFDHDKFESKFTGLKESKNLGNRRDDNHLQVSCTFKKVVVIYHRISLNKALLEKWKSYGFELYSDIQDSVINLYKHPRLIIQADSIYRLSGPSDLLILDEIESLHEHICGSSLLKKRSLVFNTLVNYINNVKKIIVADGCLKDSTCEILQTNKKSIIKIENEYRTFSHRKMNVITNYKAAIHKLIQLVEQGKKLVIPTNSKAIGEQLHKLIDEIIKNKGTINIDNYVETFISLESNDSSEENTLIQNEIGSKIKRYDVNSPFDSIQDWNKLDHLIYSPTITAGISYEEKTFDHIFGFFTNRSTSCESSLQMLFRVRNTISDDMFMYCADDNAFFSLPFEDHELNSYIDNKMKSGNSLILESEIEYDNYAMKAKKNDYYTFYRNFLKKTHLSKDFHKSFLYGLLTSHGIKVVYLQEEIEKKDLNEINSKMKDIIKTISEEQAFEIWRSHNLDKDEFEELINRKQQLTKDELFSLKKYMIQDAFELSQPLTVDFIKANVKYINQYKLYKRIKDDKIDDLLEEVKVMKEASYIKGLETTYEEMKDAISSDSEEDDGICNKSRLVKMINKKQKKIYKMKSIKKSIHQAIHYDTKYHKLYHVLQFVKTAGFDKLTSEEMKKVDFEKWFEYIRDNEDDLVAVFGCKRYKFKENNILFDEKSMKSKIAKYIQSKIESVLGINIRTPYKKGDEYEITTCFELVI